MAPNRFRGGGRPGALLLALPDRNQASKTLSFVGADANMLSFLARAIRDEAALRIWAKRRNALWKTCSRRGNHTFAGLVLSIRHTLHWRGVKSMQLPRVGRCCLIVFDTGEEKEDTI